MPDARKIVESYQGKPLRIMEVCGTHTHEIFRLGIRKILPENIRLISGPGCPVCVTPAGFIDKAVFLAEKKNAAICTFGDLVRVPGTETSLAGVRSGGAEIRAVYSPLDAVEYAERNPEKQVVFLSVGFETTVPGACLAVKKARKKGIRNFSILTANKTMPMAYLALEGSADAFLFPGHVSVITGTSLYETLRNRGISGVVAGFKADEILSALAVIVQESSKGEPFFRNCYQSVVKPEGNPLAMKLIEEIMEPCDSEWRGLGTIPESGLKLRPEFSEFDAELRFSVPPMTGRGNPACRCGDILRGDCTPGDCPLFGKICNPMHPAGACMVSGEGTCSAYYQYGEL